MINLFKNQYYLWMDWRKNCDRKFFIETEKYASINSSMIRALEKDKKTASRITFSEGVTNRTLSLNRDAA